MFMSGRRIRLAFVLIVIFFVSHNSQAQSIKEIPQGNATLNELYVQVRDSLTAGPILGASVQISNKTTQLNLVTGREGNAYSRHQFDLKDTLRVSVNLLGYKKLDKKIQIHSYNTILSISMVESTDTLTTLVFKDDAMLMVSKGDTIVYNVSQLKAMKGDNLASLLSKIPGIAFSDGNVIADGKPVDKILVNGTTIFGSNIASALDLLYATDVKQIKVYDQFDQNRLLAADTLSGKQHIIDVITHKALDEISSLQLYLKAGGYPDKTHYRSDQFAYGAGADVSRFSADKPSITINLGASRNTGTSSNPKASTSPMSVSEASFSYGSFRDNNYQLSLALLYSGNRRVSGIYTEKEYLKTSPLYGSRYANDSERINKNSTLKAYADYSHAFKDKYQLKYLILANLDKDLALEEEKTRFYSSNADEIFREMSDSKTTKSASAFSTVSFKAMTGHGSLDALCEMQYKQTNLQGSIVDTLNSDNRVYSVGDGYGKSFEPLFSVKYTGKLSSKMSMEIFGRERVVNSNNTYLAQEPVLSLPDYINTYQLSETRNIFDGSFSLSYGQPYDSFYASAGLSYSREETIITDKLPEEFSKKHSLSRLFPMLSLALNDKNVKLTLDYREYGSLPNSYYLRNRLDNSSTIQLIAGNPDLKSPLNRKLDLNLSLNLFKHSINGWFKSSIEVVSDPIINAVIPVTEETLLPQFNYVAMPGTILSQPVNGKTAFKTNSKISIGKRIKAISSTFNIGLGHILSLNPYLMMGQSGNNLRNDISATVGYQGTPAQWLICTASYSPSWAISHNDRYGTVQDFSHTLSARITSRLFEHLELTLSGIYRNNISEVGLDNEYFSPDFGISYKFGENLERRISLEFSDFLNMNCSESFIVAEEYLNRIYNRLMSRSIMLVFAVRFK